MDSLLERLYSTLRWSEKYTKTDMVYLFKSGFWGNLGTITVSLFSFILYIVFAHFLTKEQYGTYQYLLSLSAIVGTFTLTGMNTAVTQAIARGYEGVFAQAMRLQYRFNIIPLLGAWAVGMYYLAHGNLTIGYGLFIIGIFTPLLSAFNTYGAVLAGKKDFQRSFLFNLYTNIPYYLSVMVVAYSWGTPLPLLAVNLISQCAAAYILYQATLKVYKLNDQLDPATASYGKHLSFMNVLSGIINQLDSVFVFHYLGAVDLAIYSFSTAIPERLGNLFKFIPTAALPKFATKTDKEIRSSILTKTGLGILAGAVIAAAYVVLAKIFFVLFFPAYIAAVPYSQVYSLVIIASIGAVFPAALMAKRRIKSLYIFNITLPVIQLALQFTGIFFFGLWGLIVAKLLYWFIYGALALALLFVGTSEEPVVLP